MDEKYTIGTLAEFTAEDLKQMTCFTAQTDIMDRSIVPEIIYDEQPDLVEFYYAAWQSAYTHIFTCPGAPVQTYMNEGIRCHKIWIWDTCFMVMYCRYAAQAFPGIQSLENFYRVIHNNESMVLKVHHTDNPPLFAWTEYEYLLHTGDKERIKSVLLENQYLQKHYDWLQNLRANTQFEYSTSYTAAEFCKDKGFRWAGCPSGMDNTPRGKDDYESIYWLDLSCQQALSALYISRLADAIGETELAQTWKARYEEQKKFVNQRFWSEQDKMYYDRYVNESGFCKVLSCASFWPLIAEIADDDQVVALANALLDPERMGGIRPLPSVSRDDPAYDPLGAYWRGGIWIPTVYMTVKGLEKYGCQELADTIAGNIIQLQYRVWKNVEPHTIWEAYSPSEDAPATNKRKTWVRKDFCGWSALGPISMMVENKIGIRKVDALANTITWDVRSQKRSGIRNLKLGKTTVSLIAEPATRTVTIETTAPFTLILNGKALACPSGTQTLQL